MKKCIMYIVIFLTFSVMLIACSDHVDMTNNNYTNNEEENLEANTNTSQEENDVESNDNDVETNYKGNYHRSDDELMDLGEIKEEIDKNLDLPEVNENTDYFSGTLNPDFPWWVKLPNEERKEVDINDDGEFTIDLSDVKLTSGDEILFYIKGGEEFECMGQIVEVQP